MVKNKINLSLNEPYIRQVYAKEGDSGRLYELDIDPAPTPNGTMRIKRPDGVEVTSPASMGEDITESGEVVSFDALDEAPMSSLKVGIEPIQDLSHGDPSPTNICPIYANVGKNLHIPYTYSGTAGGNVAVAYSSDGSATLNGTANSSAGIPTISIATQNGFNYTLPSGTYTISLSGDTANVTYEVWNTSTSTSLASQGNATFTLTQETSVLFRVAVQNGKTYNNQKVYLQLQNGSTATSYVPYNTQTVELVGKNLFNVDSVSSITPTTVKNADGSLTVTGSRTGNNAYVIGNRTLKAGTYTLSKGSGTGDLYFQVYANGSTIANTQNGNATFTLAEDTDVAFRLFIRGSVTYNNTIYPQCEQGSTATAYEPYNGQTILSTLPQLVYGGTLDVVSGKLTVTMAYVNASTKTWSNTTVSGNDGVYSVFSDKLRDMTALILCNGLAITTNNTSDRVFLYTTNNSLTSAQIQTMISNGDVEICYTLATPTVIDLTPQQINTLLGENNLWASCGDVLEVAFAYDGMLSALPSQATEVVGRCIGDVELGGVSTMLFTLVVQKNNQGE